MKKIAQFIPLYVFLSAPVFSCEDNKLAWRDLPKLGLASCVSFTHEAMEPVDQLIVRYHSISKSEIDTIGSRIALLTKIKSELLVLADKIGDEKVSKTLRSLSGISSKKSWYLSELKILYKNTVEEHPIIKSQTNMFDDYIPLPLVNKLIFGTNISAYWGLFWLEALDPCHRMLTSYYVQWDEEKTATPFFLWLENLDIPWFSPQIHFFNSIELEDATYTLDAGIFYNKKNEKANLNSDNQEYIYIITLEKKILIVKASETVRHISLSLGFPVLAAGALKLMEGKIIYIDGESGHYQPTAFHIWQAIELLRKLNVNLDANVGIKYYENGKVVKTGLKDFLLTYQEHISSFRAFSGFLPNFHLN
ncbi:MAG: hypothetical protein K0M45_11905 [Candidatus Paracaedibacteraceae bacterium]|nr:hypothetical protein [Candidatus Paracaedibacteraceae bacterium]